MTYTTDLEYSELFTPQLSHDGIQLLVYYSSLSNQ